MKKNKTDDDIRVHNDLDFKKSLHGYDIAEVDEYVFHLQDDFQTTCNVYEEKVNDFKSKLALSDRERHTLKDKLQEVQDEIQKLKEDYEAEKQKEKAAQQENNDKEIAQYKQTITDLQEKLESVKKQIISNNDKVTADKTRKLEAENAALREAYAKLRRNEEILRKQTEKNAQLLLSDEKLAGDYEALKEKYKELEQNSIAVRGSINNNSAQLNEIKEENERTKSVLSDYEIKNSLLSHQVEKLIDENEQLKEENKKQAYECAARVNAVEADFAHSKLVFQKEMQVHSYHVQQADSLVKDLGKQLEQIKLSLNEATKKYNAYIR